MILGQRTTLVLVLVAGGFLGTAAMSRPAAAELKPVTVQVAGRPAHGPQEADAADARAYAARQDASRDLDAFTGGDEVVFVGGGALLLCIILVIILL